MTAPDPTTRDPDTAPIPQFRSHERRRAAIWLAGLAVAAVVLVAIMLAVINTSGGSSDPTPVSGPTGPAVSVATTPPTKQPTSSGRKTSPSPKPTTSVTSPTGPSNRAVSCPTSAPCALSDDIGDVVGALNTYRAKKNLAPVTGKVTAGAKTCAVTSANTCPSGFFWEPVGRSGTQVISKIVDSGRGADRLLSPSLKTVQVGWAYVPSSKSFECALVIGS